MRKLCFLILVAVDVAFLCYSCKKDDLSQSAGSNPGNSDSVYYDVVAKSIFLYKKYSVKSGQTATLLAILNAEGFVWAIPALHLPKKTKLGFR
jgi:hypothetical protein